MNTYTLVCRRPFGCHRGFEGTLLVVDRIGVAKCAHDDMGEG